MTYDETSPAPLQGLTALIERHGKLAVALAFVRLALVRRKHPPDILDPKMLSPHLRRDLGLPPFGEGRLRR